MAQASDQDVIIRSRLVVGSTEFMVVERQSSRTIGGPFPALTDALGFALLHLAAPGKVLYQALDERGRITGEPMVLRTPGI
jgi:hypothetical protein